MAATIDRKATDPKIYPFYREKLAEHSAIWSDKYALTMAQALHTNNRHNINTTFHAYIRKEPFNGSFLLTAGQNIIFEWLKNNWRFDEVDLHNLRHAQIADHKTGEMKRQYTDEFVDMLANAKLELTIDAMPEGEIAFHDEPIFRINGPLWQCLMVEAAILNITNSQSLFATLAARMNHATVDEMLLEFGLRRAQAIGGLEPSRGGYVGGVDATSNMLANKYYGIPAAGTMAHAFVMLYENELQAFAEYAGAMPDNATFLVDTYDTVEGVKNACKTCRDLGIPLKGIRLDSGKMDELSIAARAIMDSFGFTDAKIAASNDLEEKTIRELKRNDAAIDQWGVGTHLVTSKQQPALGAVYKLGAVFDFDQTLSQEELDQLKDGVKQGLTDSIELTKHMRETIKLSEESAKTSIPGELDVIRHLKKTGTGYVFSGDTITTYTTDQFLGQNGLTSELHSTDKKGIERRFAENSTAYRPLQRYFAKGEFVGNMETIHDARIRAAEKLAMLPDIYRALDDAAPYEVGLEKTLYDKRQHHIAKFKPVTAA